MSGVGKRLAEERKRLGYSQSAFADLVGVSFSTQRRYEDGRSSPDTDYLHALKKHEIDVDYVLSGDTLSDRQSDKIIHALITLVEQVGRRIGCRPEAIQEAAYYALENPSVFDQGGVIPDRFVDALLSGCDLEIDGVLLIAIIEGVDKAIYELKSEVASQKKAQAIAMLYRTFKASGKVDPTVIKEAVKLAAD